MLQMFTEVIQSCTYRARNKELCKLWAECPNQFRMRLKSWRHLSVGGARSHTLVRPPPTQFYRKGEITVHCNGALLSSCKRAQEEIFPDISWFHPGKMRLRKFNLLRNVLQQNSIKIPNSCIALHVRTIVSTHCHCCNFLASFQFAHRINRWY